VAYSSIVASSYSCKSRLSLETPISCVTVAGHSPASIVVVADSCIVELFSAVVRTCSMIVVVVVVCLSVLTVVVFVAVFSVVAVVVAVFVGPRFLCTCCRVAMHIEVGITVRHIRQKRQYSLGRRYVNPIDCRMLQPPPLRETTAT
jgi:hypothetical protein